MNGISEIANEAALPDLEALRVLVDGRRHEIVTELIAAPLTIRQLAERLHLPRTRLYYHIELLELHGIVRVVQTRMVSGALERTYRAAARNFRVDRRLLSNTAAAAIDDAQAGILEAVADDIRRRRDTERDPLVTRTFVRLTPERYSELERRLRALIGEYATGDDDGATAELALALFSLENA
ncbi:MAG TPA: helix-turn-helix domain-containing protein [Candidatus Lustribacter sp.]|nr:helix-turn-helix domain-containing protein [Candidatus Lustribacter sp.]